MEQPVGFTPTSSPPTGDALLLELQRLDITTKIAKILGVTGALQSFDCRSPRILNSLEFNGPQHYLVTVLMPSRNLSRDQSLL